MMTPKPIQRISFVYPPYGTVKNEPGIKVVKENYGIFPSLSLAYVAAVVERAGYQIQFIDANALGLTKSQVAGRLHAFNPDLVCYTLTTYLFHQNLEWIRGIKAATGVPTLVGGVHMGIYPAESFSRKELDYAVTGEAEETVPEFLAALSEGRDLSQVQGIVYRDENGEPVVTPYRPPFLDIDNAPFPARHHLPNDRYYSFISQFKNFTPLITSRGCPFRCIFCEQGGRKFRPRSPGNVCDEIQECYDAYTVREFDFFDSSFTTDKRRVLAICDEIIKRGQKVAWAIRSRVDLITPEILGALKEAGCKRIYYGIESGCETILDTLRKKTTIQKIRDVIRETRRIGIDTFGYFMIGSPGETEDTIRQSISLALELHLDYAQFSKVTPMPATELYEMLMKETGRDYWREAILNDEEIYVPRPACNLTEDEIQAWTRKAYLKFYFRPKYILHALMRVRSIHELIRSAYTAFSMLWTRKGVFARAWLKKIQY